MKFKMIYHFLLQRMKIEKVEKLGVKLHDKTEYVMHIRNLKEALNHGLVLKKVHRFVNFKQKAWLKSYIDIQLSKDTDLIKKRIAILKKIFAN